MWPSDTIFTEVIATLFPGGSPFQLLPTQIEQTEARDASSLRAGFDRLFACPEAKQANNVVFIWAVDKSFCHSDGKESTIVYVEKSNGSIYSRWSRYIWVLATGSMDTQPTDSENLRSLARDNLRFYRTIIGNFGPLRVWWASVSDLNKASGQQKESARDWERLILKRYHDSYGCLPLKNRRR